jgi:hypothetical protein
MRTVFAPRADTRRGTRCRLAAGAAAPGERHGREGERPGTNRCHTPPYTNLKMRDRRLETPGHPTRIRSVVARGRQAFNRLPTVMLARPHGKNGGRRSAWPAGRQWACALPDLYSGKTDLKGTGFRGASLRCAPTSPIVTGMAEERPAAIEGRSAIEERPAVKERPRIRWCRIVVGHGRRTRAGLRVIGFRLRILLVLHIGLRLRLHRQVSRRDCH